MRKNIVTLVLIVGAAIGINACQAGLCDPAILKNADSSAVCMGGK